MKKIGYVVISILGFFIALSFAPVQPAHAGETEALIKKLIQKGVLSESEGQELLKKASKKEKETAGSTMELPKWVKNIKFKGDFRLRYQYEDTDNDGNDSRVTRDLILPRYQGSESTPPARISITPPI